MDKKLEILQEVLAGLMLRYSIRVPDVSRIVNAMILEGMIQQASDIGNDHIAFRTLGVENLGIGSLERIFLHLGYNKRDYYFFPEKKLDAYWYSPPLKGLPRIFISALRVNDLSPESQQIIRAYTNAVKKDPVDALDLNSSGAIDEYLHRSSWGLPWLRDYETLSLESEYAAWAIYNRYYLNHFTMSVHNLPKGYDNLENFNIFLEKQGFILNSSGGKIKTSPDVLLLQSSTVAEMVNARFMNGEEKMIPGSYVEFAERRVAPDGNLREGFEAANANKIFESTYLDQVRKRKG
jgi:hypothetical protein